MDGLATRTAAGYRFGYRSYITPIAPVAAASPAPVLPPIIPVFEPKVQAFNPDLYTASSVDAAPVSVGNEGFLSTVTGSAAFVTDPHDNGTKGPVDFDKLMDGWQAAQAKPPANNIHQHGAVLTMESANLTAEKALATSNDRETVDVVHWKQDLKADAKRRAALLAEDDKPDKKPDDDDSLLMAMGSSAPVIAAAATAPLWPHHRHHRGPGLLRRLKRRLFGPHETAEERAALRAAEAAERRALQSGERRMAAAAERKTAGRMARNAADRVLEHEATRVVGRTVGRFAARTAVGAVVGTALESTFIGGLLGFGAFNFWNPLGWGSLALGVGFLAVETGIRYYAQKTGEHSVAQAFGDTLNRYWHNLRDTTLALVDGVRNFTPAKAWEFAKQTVSDVRNATWTNVADFLTAGWFSTGVAAWQTWQWTKAHPDQVQAGKNLMVGILDRGAADSVLQAGAAGVLEAELSHDLRAGVVEAYRTARNNGLPGIVTHDSKIETDFLALIGLGGWHQNAGSMPSPQGGRVDPADAPKSVLVTSRKPNGPVDYSALAAFAPTPSRHDPLPDHAGADPRLENVSG